jgi:hypothetical protein
MRATLACMLRSKTKLTGSTDTLINGTSHLPFLQPQAFLRPHLLTARILLAGSIATEMTVRGMKKTMSQDVPLMVIYMEQN